MFGKIWGLVSGELSWMVKAAVMVIGAVIIRRVVMFISGSSDLADVILSGGIDGRIMEIARNAE